MTDTTITPEGFARYLEYRMPKLRAVEVVDLAKFPRGASRETWAARAVLTDTSGKRREQSYSIRRDLLGGAIQPYPLRLEFDVYWRLRDSQVPIARPLWFEEVPEWLLDGRAFYVRERVDGSWEVPNFYDPDPRYDEMRVETAKEHLRKLALVHTCDWRALGFAELFSMPPDEERCALHRIDTLEAELRRFQVEPLPVVTEALGALRKAAPRTASAVTLCKGTNGLGEEVWRDGQIVAMSDWEEACICDPANDFAHTQDLLPPPDGARFGGWGLQDALDYYTSVSGIRVTAEQVAFYRALRSLEVALFSHHAVLPLIAGTDRMARLAWVSTEMLFMGQLGLARFAGLKTPDPARWLPAGGTR